MDVAKLGVVVDPSGARAGMAEINTGMASMAKMAKLATAAVIGVGIAMVKLGNDFAKASRSIQVDTGATGDALKQLEGDFKAVLKTVPDDMAKVAKVMGTLNTMTGQTGESLQGLARNILDVSRLMGEDAASNANLFGKALNQWGIEAADSERILDVLFKTTQDYGLGLGELTGQLNTFGPVMKTAGFTIEETADMMGRFSKAGIDWTRIAPGLNAALRNMAKEGIDVEVALRQAFVEIENATAGTERLNVATKLFGAEGAQRLKAAVDAGLTSFSDLGTAVMGTEGQIRTMSDATQTLGERFGILTNQIKSSLEPAASAMLGWVEKLADNIDVLAVALGAAGLAYVLGSVAIAFGAAATATGIFAAGVLTLNGTLFTLGATMAILQAFFTGPLGIALLVGAAAAALYVFVKSNQDVEKALIDVSKQLNIISKAHLAYNKVASDKTATLVQLQNARDKIKALQDETEALMDVIAARLLDTKAIYAHAKALDEEWGMYPDIIKSHEDLLAEVEKLTDEWNTQSDSLKTLDDRIADLKTEQDKLNTSTETIIEATDEYVDSVDDVYDAMIQLHPELESMADALWKIEMAKDAGLISNEVYEQGITDIYNAATEATPAIEETTGAVVAMTNEADPFATAWEEATKRIDEAFADAWKGAFDSFSDFANSLMDAFKRLLAEMAHQAITKPILVSLGLTTSGGAQAGGFNLSNITSLFSGDGFNMSGLTNLFGGYSMSNSLNSFFGVGGSGVNGGFVGPPAPGTSPGYFGGSNLGIGVAGILGSLFGAKFGDEKYGGMAGGFGAVGGYMIGAGAAFGGTAMGMKLGMMAGPIGAVIGAILGTVLSKAFGDDNANSKLSIWTGDYMNRNGSRPFEETEWGYQGYNKDGSPNRFQYNAPLGSLGASGQHIGNKNDDQISDEDFQAWLSGMQEVFEAAAKMDTAIIDTLGLTEKQIKSIATATEEIGKADKKMAAPDVEELLHKRYEIVFNEIGGLADEVFDRFKESVKGIDVEVLVLSTVAVMTLVKELGDGTEAVERQIVASFFNIFDAFDTAVAGIDAAQLVAAASVVMVIVDELGGEFDDLGADMINMSVAMVKATDDISLIDATLLTAAFVSAIDIMSNLFNDFEKATTSSADTMWGAYHAMVNQTWELVKAFDASAVSTSNLITGMQQQYNATMQMLFAIKQYKDSVQGVIGGIKKKIEVEMIGLRAADFLGKNATDEDRKLAADKAQYNYYSDRVGGQMDLLAGITDPDRIMSVLGNITGGIDSMWGFLSGEQKLVMGDDFLKMISDAETLAQDRLDVAEMIVQGRHDRLVGAIEDGFTSIGAADLGPATEKFAVTVTDFNSGSTDILAASRNMVAAAGTMIAAANAMNRAATETT